MLIRQVTQCNCLGDVTPILKWWNKAEVICPRSFRKQWQKLSLSNHVLQTTSSCSQAIFLQKLIWQIFCYLFPYFLKCDFPLTQLATSNSWWPRSLIQQCRLFWAFLNLISSLLNKKTQKPDQNTKKNPPSPHKNMKKIIDTERVLYVCILHTYIIYLNLSIHISVHIYILQMYKNIPYQSNNISSFLRWWK